MCNVSELNSERVALAGWRAVGVGVGAGGCALAGCGAGGSRETQTAVCATNTNEVEDHRSLLYTTNYRTACY